MTVTTVNEALMANEISDDDILSLAYGIKQFEFSPYNRAPFDRATPELSARLDSLRARLAELETAPPQQAVDTQNAQCDCGHSINPTLVMTTSRGTACPDCYDRVSN